MFTDSPEDNLLVKQCAYLAANVQMPSGERMLDRLIVYANTVRAARKARFPRKCVVPLEEDMIRVLEDFYRWAEWYRSPPRG